MTRDRPVIFFTGPADFGKKAHDDDAAYDLAVNETVTLLPGETCLAGTGLRLELPSNWAGLVLPRSSTAVKRGLIIPNSPGLIDPGYRGEVKVPLHRLVTYHDLVDAACGNRPSEPLVVAYADRVAQLLLFEVTDGIFYHSAQLAESARGSGGFGSTGLA